jgi:CBS domain-containing protein
LRIAPDKSKLSYAATPSGELSTYESAPKSKKAIRGRQTKREECMQVGTFLRSCNQSLAVCADDESIGAIAARLSSKNIGAMPVCGADRSLIGVISERDIVRAFAKDAASLRDRRVRDLMTSSVISCDPKTSMNDAEKMMNDGRVRHLPVVEDGKTVGMLSIRDLMVWRVNAAREEINVLRDVVIAARHV